MLPPWIIPHSRNKSIWLSAVVMVTGLFAGWWSADTVLLAYLFETIFIGILHALKMAVVYSVGKTQQLHKTTANNGFMMIPFFLIHYNFFIFVQSAFIFLFLGMEDKNLNDTMNVFGNYAYLLSKPGAWAAIGSMAFFNVMQSVTDFFLSGRIHKVTLNDLFMQPYLRILVQQVVAILGGFFLILLHAGTIAALLLIAVRTTVDLAAVEFRNNAASRKALVKRVAKDTDDPADMEKKLEQIFMN